MRSCVFSLHISVFISVVVYNIKPFYVDFKYRVSSSSTTNGVTLTSDDDVVFNLPHFTIIVVSYNSEPALGTNLEEDATLNQDAVDPESLRQSEEMMKEFMKITGGVEDNTNKKERTKTIIKTIKV